MATLFRLAAAASAILAGAGAVSAQIVPDQYIVILQEPAGLSRTSTVRRESAAAGSQRARVRAMIEQRKAEILNTYTSLVSGFGVRMPAGAHPGTHRALLEGLPGVSAVYPVRIRKPYLTTALPIHGVPDAWNAIGGKDKAGAGIKVGIIDTGIDNSQPMLQDGSLPIPPGFPKVFRDTDKVYTNSKVIVAKAYPSTDATAKPGYDKIQHGTSVASVVAGASVNSPFGVLTGLAPKAWLGNYKVFPDSATGAPDNLIVQALDDAFADGMDIVNLSLGSSLGDPANLDALALLVEQAVTRGMIVCVAAGNDGPDPNTIGSPAITAGAITVGATVNGHVNGATVTPASGVPLAGLPGSRTLTRTTYTGPLKDVAGLDPSGLACSGLPAGSLSGRIALVLRGTCYFDDKIRNVQDAGATAMVVYTDQAHPAVVMSITASDLPAVMIGYADGLTLQQVAAGGGSVAIDFLFGTINRVDSYSSRGPAIDGSLKPDLVAVGSTLEMASAGGGFAVGDGTSFSSPMVAGAAALLKSARPGLTPVQYKSLLVNSARPLFVAGQAPSSTTESGAGVLQVLAALGAGAALDPTGLSFGAGEGGSPATRTFTITNVEGHNDTFTLEAVAVSGNAPKLSASTITLSSGESQTVTVTWDLTGFKPGTYEGYIRVFGDHAIPLERLPYWYGVPSQNPVHVTLLDPPPCAKMGALIEVDFRVTDEAGLPVTTVAPSAVATFGNTSAPAIEPLQLTGLSPILPGTYALTTTAPAVSPKQSFTITAGAAVKNVSIPVSSACRD